MLWVNATDPTGSDLYTTKWYTFTPRAAGTNSAVADIRCSADLDVDPLIDRSLGLIVGHSNGANFAGVGNVCAAIGLQI